MTDDKGSEDDSSQQHRRRPRHMVGRLGGFTESSPPSEYDEIPDSVENNAEYWKGRYHEIEKSYQDIGSILYKHRVERKHQRFDMVHNNDQDDLKEIYHRTRALAGLLTGTWVILHLADSTGLISLTSSVAIPATIAITAILDAISVPSILSSIRERITSQFTD